MGVCRQNSCYYVAAFRDSILLDMQHDHVLKKLNFDLLTWSGASVCVCVGGGGICGQNICYNVAAFRDSI